MASSARIEELEKKFNENPRRYFAPLANEYRKAGEIEQAITLCRAYLPQQPGHMSGHIVFGQALFDAGHLDESQGVFETALSLDPENLIALRHLGDIARLRGDVSVARNWYQRVLDADPRNDEIAAQLAELNTGTATAPAATEVASKAAPEAAPADVSWKEVNPEQSPAESKVEPPSTPEVSTSAAVAESPAAQSATRPDKPPAAVDDDIAIDLDALFDEGGSKAEPAVPDVPAAATTAEPTAAPTARAPALPDGDLEVAEFVPPESPEALPRALGLETGHESVVGGEIEQMPGGQAVSGGSPTAFVTETMAELYLQQGFVREALAVYRQLLEASPDDPGLRERVDQLEHGARSSVSMAELSEEVIEAAKRRQASPMRRSMRAFLGALAARRAPRPSGEQPAIQPEGGMVTHVAGASGESGPPVLEEPIWETPAPAEVSRDAPDAPGSGVRADPGAGAPPERDDAVRFPTPAAVEQFPEVARQLPESKAAPAPPPSLADSPAALDVLFDGRPVTPDDQAAASALAGAYSGSSVRTASTPLSGRPARTAPTELSLDHVFRESGGDAGLGRQRSDFSFDQFFADDAAEASARQGGEPEAPPSDSEQPGEDDIGQFNDWLEGLKKK